MPAEFHYIKQGRAFGPIDVQDFLSKYQEGLIAALDLVRVEGQTVWSPASTIVDNIKAGFLDTVPPPVSTSTRALAKAAGGHTVFTSVPPRAATPAPSPSRKLKRCTHCGTRTGRNAAFCHRCGNDLSMWRCPSCQDTVERGAKFCGHCGLAL